MGGSSLVGTLSCVDRVNPLGIPRNDLSLVLTTKPELVALARATDKCLLCAQPGVNEAGLCDLCTWHLTEPELNLVEKWCAGVRP